MTTTFISAISRSDLDDRLLNLLEDRIDGQGVPRFLYLSPTRRKNREMVVRLRQRRKSWRPHMLAPLQLAERLIETLQNAPLDWASHDLKILLIHNILHEPSADGYQYETLRFASGKTPVGIARHAAHALDFLARRGLRPEDPESGLNPAAARDLGVLLQRFKAVLMGLNLGDPSSVLALAAEALREDRVSLPEEADMLALDGFAAPERSEAEFILRVAERFSGKEIIATIPPGLAQELKVNGLQRLPRHFAIFRQSEPLFQRLGLTDDAAVESCASRSCDGSASPLAECSLTRYLDRVAEVKGIARAIKRTFLSHDPDKPLKPEDFHVAAPRIDPYYRLFIEIFPRYGIPFSITRGIPLSSIPVVGLISCLLEAVAERDHQALFNFFSSSLVCPPRPGSLEGLADFLGTNEALMDAVVEPAPETGRLSADQSEVEKQDPDASEPGAEVLDIRVIARACREAGVRGGQNLHRDWLEPFSRYYGAKIADALVEDEPDKAGSLRRNFRALTTQIWLLGLEFEAFDRLQHKQNVEDFVPSLEELLARYSISRNLIASLTAIESEIPTGGRIILEKNVKGFNRGLEVISEIAGDLTLAGVRCADINLFREIFRDRRRREMIQEAGDLEGVSISQLLELRNVARPVVFMAGLTADDFPMAPEQSFLLPHGPDSEMFRRSVEESDFILSQAMTNTGRLFLSYPSSDGDESLDMSPLLEDLLRSKKVELTEPNSGDDDCYCAYEALESAGRARLEGAPMPWDLLLTLPISHPLDPDAGVEHFHRRVRQALLSALFKSRTDAYGPYDGMIREKTVLEAIAAMLDGPGFAYSTSMLNLYLQCPLRFFFVRILGLAPVREIPEDVDAAETGSLVHTILARFYRNRIRDGEKRITHSNRPVALAKMRALAEDVLERHHLIGRDSMDSWAVRKKILSGLCSDKELGDDAFRARVDKGTDMPRQERGLLRILIDHEADLNLPMHPTLVESCFGLEGYPPLILRPSQGPPVRVRGRIDRIDVYRPQDGKTERCAWIIDYKTGAVPTGIAVKEGRDLQLPVYLLAVLDGRLGLAADQVGACFVSLRLMEETPRKCVIFTQGTPAEAVGPLTRTSWSLTQADLDGIRDRIISVDASIRKGEFPRAKSKSACATCDFVYACFRDDDRIALIAGSDGGRISPDSNVPTA
jgi:RecB family exonuclease